MEPPFCEYHFIDLDEQKVSTLAKLAASRPDVNIYHGDCNRILLDRVFPLVEWNEYRRALCLLDPYGLHLDWAVIADAGRRRTVDLFLNFPILDMNRNVLWRDRQGVAKQDLERMTAFWGDATWKQIAYAPSHQGSLFGPPDEVKMTNEVIAEAFRQRLQGAAGFRHVPQPVAMRNSQNAVLYYLYFASQKPVAAGIVRDIFGKYRKRGCA
jgi:three-Cys-motif partner protein